MTKTTTFARSSSTPRRRSGPALLACGLAVLAFVLLAPAARGDGRGHGHGHGYGHRFYYPRSYFSFSFGYPFYRPFYYPYAYPYDGFYGYYGYPGPAYAAVSADVGAVHLAVKPKKAAVYLDGQQIGLVKNYDGYPRYLWLKKGEHQLVFYLEGYRTHAETFRIQPGAILKLKYRLTPGEATPPEQLFASAPAALPAPRQASEAAPSAAPSQGGDESWRERGTVQRDVRATPGQLRLRIEPTDAVVYLDGRFVGSGEEIGRLHGPLVVDVGRHTVEIARPGYRTQRLDVDAKAGEEVWLEVALEPTDR